MFMNRKRIVTAIAMAMLMIVSAFAKKTNVDEAGIVVLSKTSKALTIATSESSAPILIDVNEVLGVETLAHCFAEDFARVGLKRPNIVNEVPECGTIVIIGTVEGSQYIKKLAGEGKINLDPIKGFWEASLIQVVKKPFPNVKRALVIVGSDKRGAIYGMFNISREMGVSPWYWWADVPTPQQSLVAIKKGIHLNTSPKVKYRGLFLNDEEPALGGWARATFGGFNHEFYTQLFELTLRMKGNYVWPAMWGSAFYADDPKNGVVANEYGIVIGTSHHEPLARAHSEWRRSGGGEWNFSTNAEGLKEFWKGGMERVKDWDALITVGMRGDGDEAMGEGTAIHLLEEIVAAQREIIENVTDKPANETPQMWALYKEVQDYYDKGMQVPDDVTLLFCDDNWGNVRKLPELDAKPRSGGYGIYYHFDYVGGPRSYRWINNTQIERTWEQMKLSYEHGVDRVWIVNVGDLKPMEFPLSFWFDMAWNPEEYTPDNLHTYYEMWAQEQFDGQYTKEIADLLRLYTKYNARIKPELLDHNTYSLENFDEWNQVNSDFQKLAELSKEIEEQIDPLYFSAYYQLVGHPVEAMANLYKMYYNVALNRYYAKEKNSRANDFAEKAKEAYVQDSMITIKYHGLNDGKWNHFMDQTHIGYFSWSSPRVQRMPHVFTVEEAKAKSNELIDFTTRDKSNKDEYIAIEAEDFTRSSAPEGFEWKVVKNLGKTGDAVISLPIKKGRVDLSSNSPKLSYDVELQKTGKVIVSCYFSPTINYSTRKGFYYGLSFDSEDPIRVNYDNSPYIFNYNGRVSEDWHGNVWNNIKIVKTEMNIDKAGAHTLHFYRVDEGLVLQKIVIETKEQGRSFLGPQ